MLWSEIVQFYQPNLYNFIRQMCSACVHVLSLIIFFLWDWIGEVPGPPPPLGYAHDGIIIIRSILGLPLLPAAHIPTALQEIHATICNDNVM